jgi:nitroimidazol reductase NimA-like FMN-containing flavoprotein (pyridoxamine 5'-phosphate oxidase superfamily)
VADEDLIAELGDGPYPCCIATLLPDGSPYSVVVWCARDGDRFTVNAAEGPWLENIRRDPRVSFVVVDTANILRHVGVDGVVVAIEPDEGYAHIDRLSRTYLGGRYQWSTPQDVPRFRIAIEPLRVRTVDIPLPEEDLR